MLFVTFYGSGIEQKNKNTVMPKHIFLQTEND